MDNELISEAFSASVALHDDRRRGGPGREKLLLAINIVGKVRDHLAAAVANGKLAQTELKELAQTAERRKRFGIL